MKLISQLRFNSLAGYVRDPNVFLISEELEWFEAGNERLLGILARDIIDNDFVYIVLARDRLKRFRAIGVEHSFPSRKKARQALRVSTAKFLRQNKESYYQHDEKGEPVDFFKPIVSNEKLNNAFRELATKGTYPASKLIEEMMNWYEDVDGNFIEQFQSTGFDARIWELYIYATFIELGYAFDRSFEAPDFLCVGLQGKFFIEATTVNPSKPPLDISTLTKDEYYNNYVPIKFGSSLFSKLEKKYWEKEHVKGFPLVFAIQDFHEWLSMSWSSYALIEYLYGIRQVEEANEDGVLNLITEKTENYKVGEKIIPAGFFHQPEAENISAIIANPNGTVAKFNRMGYLSGFGNNNQEIIRSGYCFKESDVLQPFVSDVCSSEYRESWVEGLNVYHNPQAKIPLPKEYIPGAAHFYLKDGEIFSIMPSFHPMGSTSFFLHHKNEIRNSSETIQTIKYMDQKLNIIFRDEKREE